ncbi:MAG: hypothetical protein ACRDPZ_05160 [Gaiellaceae bacterium]
MGDTAVEKPCVRRRPQVAAAVPGTAWFGAMAGFWGAFIALLAASPETLERAYDWLTSLAVVWEILMWIVLLPWAVSWVVWESSWEHWARVLVVALIAVVQLTASAPRAPR